MDSHGKKRELQICNYLYPPMLHYESRDKCHYIAHFIKLSFFRPSTASLKVAETAARSTRLDPRWSSW